MSPLIGTSVSDLRWSVISIDSVEDGRKGCKDGAYSPYDMVKTSF